MNDYLLRAPDNDGDTKGGGEPAPSDKAAPKAETGDLDVADIMSATLDSESVPQKFRGKTVADLWKSYENLERRLSKEREAAKAKAAAPPPAEDLDEDEGGPLIDLSPVLQLGVTQGKIDDELAAKIAAQTNVSPEDYQKVASLLHRERLNIISEAATKLGQERDIEIDGLGLVQAAVDSGLFSDRELAGFDNFMKTYPGSIEPFRIIADRLEEAGFVLSTLTVDNPIKKPTTRQPLGVPLAKGSPLTPATTSGFASRKEYLKALIAAGNDREKKSEVDRRLKMSKIARWPDRDEQY